MDGTEAMMAEVEGFAQVERAYLQRFVRGFDWRQFEEPSPRHRLSVPLERATVALVGTGGARTEEQPAFAVARRGDPSYRVIPAGAPPERLRFNHVGYNVRTAYADPDCVYPLALLRAYVDEGRIGRLAASAYSTMGYATQTDTLLDETGPAIARGLLAEGVDLAVLVPT
ncbi:MAG: glycine/sarcosine/betaine reductase selenoprotein B family protein [Chloroflexota bacterium]